MILTSWGYSLPDATTLADIITETEFNTMTAGRYANDPRISTGIAAASQALRNYCGWHLATSMNCKVKWNVRNRGIIRSGADLLVQLPARFVSSVTSINIDNEPFTNFFADTNGMLTIFNVGPLSKQSVIEIAYIAGVMDTSGIKQLVADMVTLGLAKSYGVTSEAAGGVSITYNSNWTNGSFDRIFENNAALLNPYRLEGVF